jgi:hypothetical protein
VSAWLFGRDQFDGMVGRVQAPERPVSPARWTSVLDLFVPPSRVTPRAPVGRVEAALQRGEVPLVARVGRWTPTFVDAERPAQKPAQPAPAPEKESPSPARPWVSLAPFVAPRLELGKPTAVASLMKGWIRG